MLRSRVFSSQFGPNERWCSPADSRTVRRQRLRPPARSQPLTAYAQATTIDRRGAVMLGDEMIDEASRKMAQAIVAKGRASGLK